MSKFEQMKAALAAKREEEYRKYIAAMKSWVLEKYPTALEVEDGLFVVKEVANDLPKTTFGDFIQVHYTGKFTDGKLFDTSHKRNKPFAFIVGEGSVIAAWDKGLQHFSKGEKGLLIASYKLAYGESGAAPTIPPKCTLIFEVEIV